MWLDRLAGQHSSAASSQPSSRSLSPLPRRTNSSGPGPYPPLFGQAQRTGYSARSSSLSLISNDSSSSLPASGKRLNGSALKQSSTVVEAPDCQKVLRAILGVAVEDTAADEQREHHISQDDLDFEFYFGGLSLGELLQSDMSGQERGVDVSQTEEDYAGDKAKFEELHRSIQACDEILNSVETNLSSFRNDLAAVSADIETLQARSSALNIRLENRRAVEKALGPVIEELSISPLIVSKISEGHIDEAWIKALAEVDKRAAAQKKSPTQPQSKAAADLGPLLEKLVLKAVERIRDFIVSQIKALRSPHINAQIIQQQNFSRFRDLYAFLHRHQPALGEEICQAYMNTMRWYYLNQFSRYAKSLGKLKLHTIDKNDVLGHEESSRKATVLSGSKMSGSSHDAFNLGRRIEILRTSNQAALSSYLAEEDCSTHYLEVPFRNFNLALIDNAAAEYTFLVSFFTPTISVPAISRHFYYIFEPTFGLGQSLTKSLVSDTFDGLGLLVCVRLNQHFAFQLQRRRVPAADSYINGTVMILWPRLQSVMDAHCESMRALIATLPTRASSAASAKAASATPHVSTQRFGQLLHGILALSAEAGDDEPVVTSLRRLRSEVEAFVTKYSQAIFGADKRKQERFLYSNYSLVLTIISDVHGKLAMEQQKHFEELKKAFQDGV